MNESGSIGTEKNPKNVEYLLSKKGSAKLAIWNTVNLVEKKLFVLGMPLEKLLGSKLLVK